MTSQISKNEQTIINSDSNMGEDQELEKAAEIIFQSFVQEALNLPGDHGIPHKDILLNMEVDLPKLKEGLAFIERHLLSIAWTFFAGGFAIFNVQRVTSVLFRNEMYNSSYDSLIRAFSTLRHIMRWLKEGLENPLSRTAMDVYAVRNMHMGAVKKLANMPVSTPKQPKKNYNRLIDAIRKDLEHISTPDYLPQLMTSTPSVLISQFDMSISLSIAFLAPDLNPSVFGLHDFDGYESYVYYFGVLGRYLGVENRFNLALLPNPALRKVVLRKLADGVFTPCYKNMQESELLTTFYYVEKPGLAGLLTSMIHLVLKDVLGAGPAAHTRACKRRAFFSTLMSGLFPLMKFPPIRWAANASLSCIAKLGIAWLNWKTSYGERRADPERHNMPKYNNTV